VSIDAERLWVGIGLLGQGMFAIRLIVQWAVSERRGRPMIPIAFWWFSIAGGLCLLAYSVWRMDPVFILGQSMGLLIYMRNLALERRSDEA